MVRPTNEYVHVVGSRRDDVAEYDQARANDSDIATPDEIGQGADEWANGGKREKIPKDL